MSTVFFWELSRASNQPYARVRDSDETLPLSEVVLDEPLQHFRAGDRVAVLYDRHGVLYAEPILGRGVVRNALAALATGLERVVPGDDREFREQIYSRIAAFLHRKKREDLVRKYEKGSLKFRDLLGDYTGLSGPLRREKDGVFVYGLDS